VSGSKEDSLDRDDEEREREREREREPVEDELREAEARKDVSGIEKGRAER